jgi:hypothetical protein
MSGITKGEIFFSQVGVKMSGNTKGENFFLLTDLKMSGETFLYGEIFFSMEKNFSIEIFFFLVSRSS